MRRPHMGADATDVIEKDVRLLLTMLTTRTISELGTVSAEELQGLLGHIITPEMYQWIGQFIVDRDIARLVTEKGQSVWIWVGDANPSEQPVWTIDE